MRTVALGRCAIFMTQHGRLGFVDLAIHRYRNSTALSSGLIQLRVRTLLRGRMPERKSSTGLQQPRLATVWLTSRERSPHLDTSCTSCRIYLSRSIRAMIITSMKVRLTSGMKRGAKKSTPQTTMALTHKYRSLDRFQTSCRTCPS